MGEASFGEVLLDDDLMVPHLDLRPWRKSSSWRRRVCHGDWSPKDWSVCRCGHLGIVGSHVAKAIVRKGKRKLEDLRSPHWRDRDTCARCNVERRLEIINL